MADEIPSAVHLFYVCQRRKERGLSCCRICYTSRSREHPE